MKINVLDKKVYNRIAAGEVVERPFSVIKELVENSIDAGAKNITISIWNGGKDRVEITDDGCGIEKSELHKAFLPHATSKIADVKDLDNIATLGFRGEALASIASVAKVTIVSKPESQEFGATIYSEGGNVSNVTDAPSGGGTKITVDDLFFNTPVRAKFLKTTRAEEGDITDIVGRLVLANPYISFKYFEKIQNDNSAFWDKNRKNWLHILNDDYAENYNRTPVYPEVSDMYRERLHEVTNDFKKNRRGVIS